MKRLKIPVLLLFFSLLASCHQSSETTVNGGSENSGAGPWIIPGVGTTYIYETPSSDSTPTVFDTLTILATCQHLGGKTNVVTYADHSTNGEIDSEFYNVETNGDFSFGYDDNTDSLGNPEFIWDTYPTDSRQPINGETPIDSVTPDGRHLVQSVVKSFVGMENLAISTGTFSTLHVRWLFTNIDSLPNNPSDSFSGIDEEDFWFAPSIGTYVQTTDQVTEEGQIVEQSEETLIKYIPR